MLIWQGNVPDAQVLLEKSNASLAALARSDPSNADWQRDLVPTFFRE